MAVQNDLFMFSGTLGEVNYYQVGEKYFKRKAGGGFTKKAIKNKASMQKVREFNTEFARCSAAKKGFRLALEPFLGAIRSRELHSNMTRLFLELKNLDPVNPIGKRSISEGFKTKEGKQLINNFSFLPELDLSVGLGTNKDQVEIKINEPGNLDTEANRIELSCALLHCDFESAEFLLQEEKMVVSGKLPLTLAFSRNAFLENNLLILGLKCFQKRKLVKIGLKLKKV
ncbi:hypothetical protein C7S20_18465 [Christiangramia fulva]|uniref:Uncharacterized protein n=1 Tax=Christiangramia fulva TaxID=2126553 RepID=A0A2R3ZA74_9FLAO|nr:hypothetical protein [Christiangramia fulva]AVR47072.1 hypothetical protein C7S20_18465 [Christiangramia fulva]